MFGTFVLKYKWILLSLLLGMLAGAVCLLPDIEVNQDFDKHFPDNDPDLRFYREMTTQLGDEDELLMIAVRRKEGIFDSVFLNDMRDFTFKVQSLSQVKRVSSLFNIRDLRRTPFGIVPESLINIHDTDSYSSDSSRIIDDERFVERFVSADLKTMTVIAELESDLDSKSNESLMSALEELGRQFEFDEMYLMGRKYFEAIYNRLSNKSLRKSFTLCLLLIIILLGLIYRSLWAIALPLLVYSSSMVLFFGYMVLRGHDLDVMSNIAPTILLIVCISDVVHFFSKYEDELNIDADVTTSLRNSLNHIGPALLLTSLTTAVGFLSLLSSSLPGMRKFGEYIAVGVLLTFFVTIVLLPLLLSYVPASTVTIRRNWHSKWSEVVDWIFTTVTEKSTPILVGVLIISVLGVFSVSRIDQNNYFSDSLPKDHPAQSTVVFYEDNLGGIRTFEIALIPKNGHSLNDLQLLLNIEKLHTHLDSLSLVGGIYSPVTLYKSMNKAWYAGSSGAYLLPRSQEELNRQEKYFGQLPGRLFERVINKERTYGKLSARMKDIGRMQVKSWNEEIDDWILQHLDTSLLKTRIIGASAMADKIQEHAIRNMFSGLALSIFVIGMLSFLLYREWRTVMILMVINIIPLLLTAATMAIIGIELRYGTSVIFTIGFVIAVDDTIHFIGRYRRELSLGRNSEKALIESLKGTGRAIVLTSLIIFFGFFQLITSEFREAQAVGLLVGLTLLYALLSDLILGPLLIRKGTDT